MIEYERNSRLVCRYFGAHKTLRHQEIGCPRKLNLLIVGSVRGKYVRVS